MNQFLDISVRDFTPHFTRRAHEFVVNTQILLKVPVESLTTVRLIGTNFAITEFLRSLIGRPGFDNWTESLVRMHVRAIKTLTEDNRAPLRKNRGLYENRAKELS